MREPKPGLAAFHTRSRWYSFEPPDCSAIEGACDPVGLRHRFAQFPIAEDRSGKRAPDIECRDGWPSVELAPRIS
jgi:hypothetical protein